MARDFAKVTGIDLGIALAKGIADAEKLTGEDYSHWMRSLPARTDELPVPQLNPTQLGEQIGGLSARDVNRRLEAAGLQESDDGRWRLTEAGKAHGAEFPYERNGHNDFCIRWRDSVIALIAEVRS
jgi:hypothetical protein